jgi:Protein of unknown function (DUF2911)
MRRNHIPVVLIACLAGIFSCNTNTSKEREQVPVPVTLNDTGSSKAADTITPYTQPDISPMDMCYYPVNYPKLKMAKAINTPPLARMIYSRPHLEGRKLFEGILKYGEPWRLGANESTEFDIYTDVTIQAKKIKAGRYILYCIPEPDQWTIVINTNLDCWGLHPDPSKDIARFVIPVKQISTRVEYFTMMFEKTATGADLIMAWENTEARLPVQFNH